MFSITRRCRRATVYHRKVARQRKKKMTGRQVGRKTKRERETQGVRREEATFPFTLSHLCFPFLSRSAPFHSTMEFLAGVTEPESALLPWASVVQMLGMGRKRTLSGTLFLFIFRSLSLSRSSSSFSFCYLSLSPPLSWGKAKCISKTKWLRHNSKACGTRHCVLCVSGTHGG